MVHPHGDEAAWGPSNHGRMPQLRTPKSPREAPVPELRGEGSPVLPSRTPRHRRQQVDLAQQGPEQLVVMLQHQLSEENWGPVVHIVHLIKFMAQCKPAMIKTLASCGAPRVLMDVMKGILSGREGPDATEIVMAQASELLLCLVESDEAECAADVLTAESVTVLLTALTSPLGGTQARQHVAHLLRHVVSSGPAWRGPLLAHGGLEGLPRALQDPVAACDLLFMQEVLWALVGLVDAAVSCGGEVRNPHIILGTLVPLLQLLQLPHLAHLSHVAALIVRVLHVLAAGDDHSKQFLGKAGIVDLLIDAIKAERRAQMSGDDGSGDGSNWLVGSNVGRGASVNGRGPEPNLERLAQSGLTPLRRGSNDASGSSAAPGFARSHSHGRDSSSVARVNSWDRLMAALLLREILAVVDGEECVTPTAAIPAAAQGRDAFKSIGPTRLSCSALVVYGLLLPTLWDGHTSSVHRLCIIKEAVVAVKVLVGDSSSNQDRAVNAGAIPILVHLVSTGDVTLAWQAADALSNLTSEAHAPALLANGVVEELTQLLQESADALHLLTVRKQIEDHTVTGAVSMLPSPNTAYAHKPRHKKTSNVPARVQLVGRQRLSFSVSGCMYTTHGAYSMCDYCVPSACLRALLRLLGFCSNLSSTPSLPQSARNSSSQLDTSSSSFTSGGGGIPGRGAAGGPTGAARFVSSGGLYALFLLLHHELSGNHHSKMASSLTSVLNLVLDTGMDVQDEVRKVGGLALLVSLMESLARPAGLTDIYQLRVQVCLAMQRLVEGNSANKLLVRERGLIPLLITLLQSSLDPDGSQVLDDKEQVTSCALDLISACIADSPGNQDALLSAGGLRILSDMLQAATQPPPSATGRALSALAGPVRLRGSAQVLASAVRTMGLLISECVPAQLALLASPALKTLVVFSEQQPASNLAQCVVFMGCQLMRAHPQGKSHVAASGLLSLLLKMLHTSPPGPHVAAAAQGLYALCYSDVDTQNEVVAQNGLAMIEFLLRTGGVWRVHALWLLCCLMHGNSYVKNAARQTPGLVNSLMRVMRKQAGGQHELTIAAAHALAQLCQSNHANQELVADEGGLESVAEILQMVLQQVGRSSMSGSGRPSHRPPLPNGSQTNSLAASAVAAAATAAAAAAAAAGPGAELGSLSTAALYPGVLDAALRLLAAMLEFNATNKKLVRESGCLGLVADLLQRAAEVRDLTALRRAQLLPAVAAACAVVARAAQDCEDNQQRLVTGHEDLAPALFRLLSIEEPYVALEAARALEFMVIRSDLVHDRDEDRPEFEADAIRTMVTVLHTRGGPAVAAGAAGASAAGGLGPNGASAAAAAATLAAQSGFWDPAGAASEATSAPAAYGSAPPKGVVTAASVREAATVLVAIVKAAQGAVAAASVVSTSIISSPSVAGPHPPLTPTGTAPVPGTAADAPVQRSSTLARLFKWAPAAPTPTSTPAAQAAPTAAGSGQELSGEENGAGVGSDEAEAGDSESDEGPQGEITPAPLGGANVPGQQPTRQLPALQPLDALNLDHANGLATIRSLQDPNGTMGSDDWVRLVGQSAAAFQPLAGLISEGPWRGVKVHLSWLLFLLAARAPANRELLAKLERSVVTPVAGQLANAEAFYASAEAAEAVAAASSQHSPALPVSTSGHKRDGSVGLPVTTPTLPVSVSAHTSPRVSAGQVPTSARAIPVSQPTTDFSTPLEPNSVINPRPVPATAAVPPSAQPQLQQATAVQPPLVTAGSEGSAGTGPVAGAVSTGSILSDDDELEYIRREVEMLAGKANAQTEPSVSR